MRPWSLVLLPVAALAVVVAFWLGRASQTWDEKRPITASDAPARSERPTPQSEAARRPRPADEPTLQQLIREQVERRERLEARLERLESDRSAEGGQDAAADPDGDDELSAQPAGAFETEGLIALGWSRAEVEDLRTRWEQYTLEQLALDDRALREGWAGGLWHQAARIGQEDRLQRELGDAGWDALLYASGRSNRLRVIQVFTGSAAERAGIRDGDVIWSYAGRRIFAQRQLLQETSRGRPGESLEVRVLRDGGERRFFVERGPLGVQLRAERVAPSR